MHAYIYVYTSKYPFPNYLVCPNTQVSNLACMLMRVHVCKDCHKTSFHLLMFAYVCLNIIYVSVYINVYVYVYITAYVHVYINAHVTLLMCVYMAACVYVYINAYVYEDITASLYVYVNAFLFCVHNCLCVRT